MKTEEKCPVKFGTVLGKYKNIPVYSCDYKTIDKQELPNRQAYRSYQDGIFMGYKWQCVELARRWMYINNGYIFEDVAMAYDIFALQSVRVVKDGSLLPLKSFKNGAKRHPEPGCLIIWDEGGEFEITGHVAVVTEVFPDKIRFIEQNVHNYIWPEGQNYSRELKVELAEDGEYWIQCYYNDAKILGWVVQTDDNVHAEKIEETSTKLFNLQMREIEKWEQTEKFSFDMANPDEVAYAKAMDGYILCSDKENENKYFCLSESLHKEIKRATNELHALFMHATNLVLQDDKLLEKFNIPQIIWPKIHQSWDNRRNQMITGRFDFSVSEHGIKVYEYNADSASCHMECGKVQIKWAQYFGCKDGWCPGDRLHKNLVKAWKKSDVDDVLHIMQDNDPEETYHALYMKSAIESAGIKCKIIKGVSKLSWDKDGSIIDAQGIKVKWVWKTWAWETALDQIRAECDDDEQLSTYSLDVRQNHPPRLVDVLLRQEVMVYEPLWTLIPSNKAILPILWTMYPNHPYLLNSQYKLSDELLQRGYVAKPIVGRCGSNISIFDKNNSLIKETDGKFENQNQIYQQLFKLPKHGQYNVQLCTFSVDGTYGGSCTRVDPSLIITSHSEILPLRVIPDKDLLR